MQAHSPSILDLLHYSLRTMVKRLSSSIWSLHQMFHVTKRTPICGAQDAPMQTRINPFFAMATPDYAVVNYCMNPALCGRQVPDTREDGQLGHLESCQTSGSVC
ncbi:hypothetical protein J3458_001763 [Metarhizium acridum]|uniref:uncharacterized protein n=1 Tax=Metarhizium acridum TaxID=92637 RepID=UPI001C6BCF69|nr:hypothetical protein J3458_001763 [Metarhizium acridum]